MFIHKNNIETKIETNYKNKSTELRNFFNEVYLDVKNQLLDLDFDKEPSNFTIAASIIDDYLNELDKFSEANEISSQSKFRSTFLEEISVYLALKVPEIKTLNLGIFNKRIYSGIQMNNELEVEVLTKDVDFCIGREVEMIINGISNKIIVPAIAVEIKTYLDGTMFNEVMFSSGNLKNATPSVKTYVLMEYKDLANQKIISARGRNDVDEMFVLKSNKNTQISSNVLKDYFNEIKKAISGITSLEKVLTPGRLLRP